MIVLRPYQHDLLDKTRDAMRNGAKAICIQSPTGSGKTATIAEMTRLAVAGCRKVWFVVHRRELVKQAESAYKAVGLQPSVIAPGWFCDLRSPVQIASIQTLVRRLHLVQPPDLVIWDEAHHVAAHSWDIVRRHVGSKAWHIGLTATPIRLDGKGLKKYFDHLVLGPSVKWLIANNYLADFAYYAPSAPDMTSAATSMGDYTNKSAFDAMSKPTITGCAVDHYNRLCRGKRAVVFATRIEHSLRIMEAFKQAGIIAEHVDGTDDPGRRDSVLRRFTVGEVQVLGNVDLFGEGFDLPAIEAAILMRPTKSLGLYLQQVGRALRPSPGKARAIILDHAGNVKRFGLPNVEIRWELTDTREAAKAAEKTISIRVCPECFASLPGGTRVCDYCGHEFVAKPGNVKESDGELVEIWSGQQKKEDAIEEAKKQVEEAKARKVERAMARDHDSLVALAKTRGYRHPEAWARHVLASRGQGRR